MKLLTSLLFVQIVILFFTIKYNVNFYKNNYSILNYNLSSLESSYFKDKSIDEVKLKKIYLELNLNNYFLDNNNTKLSDYENLSDLWSKLLKIDGYYL